MLLDINGQQFRIKGVFEYDPSNNLVFNYENGDLVYVPSDPKLYIYHNDVNDYYSNRGYLSPWGIKESLIIITII